VDGQVESDTAPDEPAELIETSPPGDPAAGSQPLATTEGGGADGVSDVLADCDTPEGVGAGGGQGASVRVHGLTVANYNHGRPLPPPFPSGVTVTTRKVGKADVFDASGAFDVTFKASPSVTLPPVPAGLTPCHQAAVQTFINTTLAAHEQDHVNAFTSNYDGTFSAAVNVSKILDTPTMRQRALENPVNAEDQRRTGTANAASAALDPFVRPIPGLDCQEP